MSKDCKIYAEADPGPAIIALAIALVEPVQSIDTIRFVAWHNETEGKPGAFIPQKKEVVIDLGNVLNNADFYRLGMMHVPAVFFTTMWSVAHEIFHGKQIDQNPELLDLDELPMDYEIAAQTAAKSVVQQWANDHVLPPLSEWGWLGETITGLINNLYSKGDTQLLDELDLMKHGAVAEANAVLAVYEFEHPAWLTEEIAKGSFGLRLNGQYFLTALDFFGLDNTKKVKARVAQTVFMG